MNKRSEVSALINEARNFGLNVDDIGSVSTDNVERFIHKKFSEEIEYLTLLENEKNVLKDLFAKQKNDTEKYFILCLLPENNQNIIGHYVAAKARKDSKGKIILEIADSYETSNNKGFGSSYTNKNLVNQGILKQIGTEPDESYIPVDDAINVKRVNVEEQVEYNCFFHSLLNLENEFLSKKKNEVKIAYRNLRKFSLPKLVDTFSIDKTNEKIEEVSSEKYSEKVVLDAKDIGKTHVERKVSDDFVEYNFTVEPYDENDPTKYAEYFFNKLKLLSQNNQKIDLDLEGLVSNGKLKLKQAIESLYNSNDDYAKFINLPINSAYNEDEPKAFETKNDNKSEIKKDLNQNSKTIENTKKRDVLNIEKNSDNIRDILDGFVAENYNCITISENADDEFVDMVVELVDEDKYKHIKFMYGDNDLRKEKAIRSSWFPAF